MPNHTQTLNQSARKFFTGTLLSRAAGFLRDIATAAAFGISPAVAAFMLAFRLSHLARRIFGEGALQTAFIPQFEEIRQKHSQKGMQFFCDLAVNITALIIVFVTAVVSILFYLLQAGFFSQENGEVARLTMIMMPSLLFICLYGVNTALLQCEKHFFISSMAPLFFNVTWICCVLWTWQLAPSQAMIVLAYGINAACFVQWLATVPQTFKTLKPYLKVLHWKIKPRALKKFYAPFALSVIGVVATQVNSAVDPIFARIADLEGPALLWYAIRLQQLPLALFGIALSSASLPLFARAVEKGNLQEYSYLLRHALKKTFFWTIPITGILMVFGSDLIQWVYERGDFGEEAVVKTSWCLWAYALGLLPSAAVLILAPALYAVKNYRTPMIASLISMGGNIGLNAFFILGMGFGAASVAFSTSLCALLNAAILGWEVMRSFKKGVVSV